jgi:membrane-bound serine protease (ClpP class)
MSILLDTGWSDAWLVTALLIAAAVLMFLEIMTPTFGVLVILALVAAVGAVFYAFRIGPVVGICVLVGVILGVPAFLYVSIKMLPKTPLGKRLLLKKAPDATNQATPQAAELAELVGKTGRTESILRPTGRIVVDGRRYDARTEEEFLDAGVEVTILKARGSDVVVRRAGGR